LSNIKRLENKENKLKNNCEILSKQLDKHRETLPLAELIETMHIGRSELISFRVAINGASELYGFPPSTAAFHVINNIRDYNKKGQLKKELSALYLQKYTIKEVLSRDSQVLSALMNLKSHGIMEDRILYLNKLLEKAQYAPLKTNAAFPEIKFRG
jgi:chaperonin cofactor prefoldin